MPHDRTDIVSRRVERVPRVRVHLRRDEPSMTSEKFVQCVHTVDRNAEPVTQRLLVWPVHVLDGRDFAVASRKPEDNRLNSRSTTDVDVPNRFLNVRASAMHDGHVLPLSHACHTCMRMSAKR